MRRVKRITLTVLVTILAALGYPTTGEAQDVPPIISVIDTTGLRQAVRLDPPKPPPPPPVLWTTEAVNGKCVGFQFLLGYYGTGWDPIRMSGIMHRESRCNPAADNPSSSATGLLQILSSHCRWLAQQMGEPCSAARLTDPVYNIRAGAVLWSEQGYSAWSQTL
jgi:soluble lytic murein transglycosylase-like protein